MFVSLDFFMYLCKQNYTNMTREQAKQIALKSADDEIQKHGEDAIALMCPKIGKDHWTWKEYKDAIINDTNLEDSETNPIDTILNYEKYRIEHGMGSLLDLLEEK